MPGRRTEPPPPLPPVALTRASSAVTVGAMRDSLSAGHSASPAQGGCAGHRPRPPDFWSASKETAGLSPDQGLGTAGPPGKNLHQPCLQGHPCTTGCVRSLPLSADKKGRQAGGTTVQQGGLLPRLPSSACRQPSFSPRPHACQRVCVQASSSRNDSSHTGTGDHPQ